MLKEQPKNRMKQRAKQAEAVAKFLTTEARGSFESLKAAVTELTRDLENSLSARGLEMEIECL
jgi:DNA-binding TFAR19-related protein (PDSD5 family)